MRAFRTLAAVAVIAAAGCSEASSAGPATTPPQVPRELLFEWYPTNGTDKTIMTVDDAGSTRMLEPVADSAFVHADWSPDGESIVFEALSDDGAARIMRADAMLSAAEPLAECLAPPCQQLAWPAWSHDGTRIVVVQYDGAADGSWGPSHLVVIDVATGEREVVSSTPDGTTAYYKPRWSNDDDELVVQLETSPDATQSSVIRSVLEVVPSDGSAPGTAITSPELFAAHADWHPTDDLVVFQTFDFGPFPDLSNRSQLYTVRADGSQLVQLTTDEPPGTRIGAPSWSPDGRSLVAVVGHGNEHDPPVELARVDLQDGHVELLGVAGAAPRLRPEGGSL